MDLLKTLMLYMTLTFATSVQGAPTPAPTEPATPAPSALTEIVTAEAPTDVVVVTPEVAATITPTPVPTLTPAPAPTMSPNPSYRLLKQGSKGDRVKKVQERLIELGYLTGEADGVYGNQTRRAVQRFQYYNGLQQDGQAGAVTQTVLFESETVVAAVTPTPEATSTPEATQTAEPLPTDTDAQQTVETLTTVTDTPAPTHVAPMAANNALTLQPNSKMVVNGSGEALHTLITVDGVTVDQILPVYTDADEEPLVDIAMLAECLDSWSWTPDETKEHTYHLSADGYTMELTLSLDDGNDVAQAELLVDGEAVSLAAGDVRCTEDGTVLLRAAVLENAIGAAYVWEPEEQTLMLNYVSKNVAESQG